MWTLALDSCAKVSPPAEGRSLQLMRPARDGCAMVRRRMASGAGSCGFSEVSGEVFANRVAMRFVGASLGLVYELCIH